MKKIIALLLTLCMVFALCACGSKAETPAPATEAPVADVAPAYTPVTVENYGRTLTIEKMPAKVVTAGPNCSEVFCALGLADLVVGNSCDNHSRGPLDQWKADYEKIPELTYGYPTLEAVVASGCDFIYAIDWVFEGDFTVGALEGYGITVYVCEATDYDGVWKEIENLGKIFGVEDAAAAFISSEQTKLDAVKSAVAGKDVQKVFVYDSDTGNGVYTCGGPNIETQFIASAGGENICANLDKAWVGVSYEEVLAQNPDWIIIHDYEEATYEQNMETLKADPILSQLDAVKNEHFIKLSLESALPGSRTAYSVETIAQGMFPDAF